MDKQILFQLLSFDFFQPMYLKNGEFTQNGLFFDAAQKYKAGVGPAEIVRIYQKIMIFQALTHLLRC